MHQPLLFTRNYSRRHSENVLFGVFAYDLIISFAFPTLFYGTAKTVFETEKSSTEMGEELTLPVPNKQCPCVAVHSSVLI